MPVQRLGVLPCLAAPASANFNDLGKIGLENKHATRDRPQPFDRR